MLDGLCFCRVIDTYMDEMSETLSSEDSTFSLKYYLGTKKPMIKNERFGDPG